MSEPYTNHRISVTCRKEKRRGIFLNSRRLVSTGVGRTELFGKGEVGRGG